MDVCKNCGGSGRNPSSQHLDCRECDAASERKLVEQYWGSLPASMEILDAIWAVYQFRRAPVPAALTDEQIAYIGEQWDGCMYDAVGETIDIGASIRAELKKLQTTASTAPVELARDAMQVLSDFAALLPGTSYMDPPDGGNPSILVQFQRMAKDAERYRWLRHGDNDECVIQHGPVAPDFHWLPRNERLDAMIDAARASQHKEGQV